MGLPRIYLERTPGFCYAGRKSTMLKLFALMALGLAACSSFVPVNLQSKRSTDIEARKIRRIAVLWPDEIATGAKSPAVSTPSRSTDKKLSEAELSDMLARFVYGAMASMPNWQIVSESEVREVAQSIPAGGDTARLRRIGEAVHADAVVVGRMQRYRERVGDQWGAQSPASVAFVLDLIDVRRGDVVWSARFDETQKPLSENIFALGNLGGRGIRWLSAEQLTQDGVRRAVADLHQLLVRGTVTS